MKRLHMACAVGSILFSFITTNSFAIGVSGQGTWETTLLSRDLDGNISTAEAYYDTVLNITWLADADIVGAKSWSDANTWATGLNPYGSGIMGWRLPMMIDIDNDGCNWAYGGTDCGYNVLTGINSEMGSLYYDTLGNLGAFDTAGNSQTDSGLSNTGPFENMYAGVVYWFGVEDGNYNGYAWNFSFAGGLQDTSDKNFPPLYAWAVHDGDVGAALVPLPMATWLFGSGLLGLIGIARRKKAT